MSTTPEHVEFLDANTRFSIAPSVRSARDAEGLVLLDLVSGCYSSFNPVGAMVWSQIESGATLGEILAWFGAEFPTLDGQVLAHDVHSLLEHLSSEGLITVAGGRPGGELGESNPETSEPTTARDSDPDDDEKTGFWAVLVALAYLVYIDVSMRWSGARRVHEVLDATAVRPRSYDPTTIRRTCRAMDRAARSYVKRAWCLQRSAACVCLLRRRGVPAELVLGVRTFPFGAHAWVEHDGRILNDDLDHVGRFLVLDRI